MQANNFQKNIVLAVGLIMGFLFLASFGALYADQNFTPSCACIFPPWMFIMAFASLGVFIGTLTYYFLTQHHVGEKKEIKQGIKKILNFMDSDEKKIIKSLVDNLGELSQSKISELTSLDKVRLSRKIDVLVSIGIVTKEKNGMTNKIVLDKHVLDIFKKVN